MRCKKAGKGKDLSIKMIIKLHKKEGNIVAAVCDSELIGRKFEEGSHQLDLTSEFYKGEEKDDETIGDTIRNSDHVNLVGKKSVGLGIQEGVIDESHVKTIAGIPYAQAVVSRD